jgi:N-acetylglucosaminyl-diphospho-decaprenol L-rhamnosyltransferase
VLLSYCVVNTAGRELLLACLDAIERTAPPGLESEVLVLDNASGDGSVEAVRALGRPIRLIERQHRRGKAENDTALLRQASGRYCLLLNEDTEIQPEAAGRLVEALEADSGAAVASCRLLSPEGKPQPCAWRLPGVGTALAGALFLHRGLTVQSKGEVIRPVGWAQSSAMLVRREAAERVGWLDPDFFVYSDETDFCKRLGDAGWRILFVPSARAIHHHQLGTDLTAGDRRIVEFHRNRDLYLRKHRGGAVAFALRPLLAFPYLVRALGALLIPRHSGRRYLTHARQALLPGRGEGLREAAERLSRDQ